MHCHLVTVKVSIVSRTYKGMKLNSLTLYKDGLKCLNTEPVKCRSTVKHYGMLLDNVFKHVPDLGTKTLNHLLRILNIV